MEQFRLKTIREVLSVDDLKEKVNTVDELMGICEVSYTNSLEHSFGKQNEMKKEGPNNSDPRQPTLNSFFQKFSEPLLL